MQRNQESYERQMKEVSDAMDILGTRNLDVDIDALINSAFFNLFDGPNEFLTRTLNTNPGLDTLSEVSSYVDASLTLPDDLNMRRI